MRCKHFEDGICSSCTLLSLKEQEALSYKLKKTTEILQIKAFDSITTSPSNNYRNKAKWAVSGSLEAPRFGFFDKELSFHELVHCPILMSSLDQMQSILKKVIYDFKLTPYDPNSGQGELKYILLFSDPEQKNFILRFVLRSKEAIDRIKNFVLRKDEYLLQDVKVISVNLQPLNAAIIEGEEEIILTEEKDISFKLDKTFFFLGVRSFFQVNHQIAQMLYAKVATLLSDRRHKHILDLYCGVGGFALSVQAYAEKVSGIEISKEAVETAKKAALKNHFSHLNFYASDLKTTDLDPFLDVDVCILNPPRRGIDQNTIEFIKKIRPATIIYSSCNPKTLKRDELLLEEYKIKSIHAFDMFNLTEHMEVLCEFERI